MEKKKHRDLSQEAASPVIGVMLMLVVTIIIAAAVSAFAGGYADDQKETPTAQLDVQLKSDQGQYCPRLVITHLGGDALKTRDLKIVTYYNDIHRDRDGDDGHWGEIDVYKHTTDGSLDPMVPANYYNAGDYAAGTGSLISNNGYPCTISNGVPAKYWGNSTMIYGDVYTTIDAASIESVITTSKLVDEPVEIEIIHIPSGGTIFSGEVIY